MAYCTQTDIEKLIPTMELAQITAEEGDTPVSKPAGYKNAAGTSYDVFVQTDSTPPNKRWKCTLTGKAGVATWAAE
jgi:hypothetical protein